MARFRGLRSAASLKREQQPVQPRRAADDPRTQIRRLIEASTRTRGGSRSCCAIRGLRSAASLKRDRLPRLLGRHWPDPRTQIRGLIEAAPPPVARRSAQSIRGLRSAASLKLALPEGRPYERLLAIRGLRSAASLKHGRCGL